LAHATGQHQRVVVAGVRVGHLLVHVEPVAVVEVVEAQDLALLEGRQLDLGALALDRVLRLDHRLEYPETRLGNL
jgi:hypothetical protein